MDKLEKYQRILRETVERHAKFQPANGIIKTHSIIDEANGDFMVIDVGWSEKGRRVYDVTLHFQLQGESVFIERDTTDAEIVRELLEKGIDKQDIILAFNDPLFQKLGGSLAA
jgi:hypothetical protein